MAASIRHRRTEYDELLMRGVPRPETRERVQPEIERMLREWRGIDAPGRPP